MVFGMDTLSRSFTWELVHLLSLLILMISSQLPGIIGLHILDHYPLYTREFLPEISSMLESTISITRRVMVLHTTAGHKHSMSSSIAKSFPKKESKLTKFVSMVENLLLERCIVNLHDISSPKSIKSFQGCIKCEILRLQNYLYFEVHEI